MAEENPEVVFIGVSNNDTVDAGKGYVEEFDVPYAMAHAPEVWELFDVPYQPVTIVIADDGTIAQRFIGPVTGDDVGAVIDRLL